MSTFAHKYPIAAVKVGTAGSGARVMKGVPHEVTPEEAGCSPETFRLLKFVSDPANKRLFTAEAALKAFAHIKV